MMLLSAKHLGMVVERAEEPHVPHFVLEDELRDGGQAVPFRPEEVTKDVLRLARVDQPDAGDVTPTPTITSLARGGVEHYKRGPRMAGIPRDDAVDITEPHQPPGDVGERGVDKK